MSSRRYAAGALIALPLAFACSIEPDSTDGSDTTSSGGAASGGADFGTGGGVFSGTGGDVVSGTGGVLSGTGGAEATGGASPGVGGESASGGAGTGGAPSTPANPSPGCSKGGGRPAGGKVYKGGDSSSWLIFPEKYDGATPLPVLFGFHGCGSGNAGDDKRTEFSDLIQNSGFATDYVVAAPVATSKSCYDYGVDMPKAKALYTELINNYCVDMDRVFGAGHSYGAGGMLMTLTAGNNKADFDHFKMKGIAPVSGWLIGSQSTQVATMYIQGITDSERGGGDGADVVNKIVQVNGCTQTTTPYTVDACNSSHDQAPVNAGCKSYSGCDVETIWCRHDDSAYGGTFHGVPCFWKQAAFDFFASL